MAWTQENQKVLENSVLEETLPPWTERDSQDETREGCRTSKILKAGKD